MERITTGIKGLDELMEGGMPYPSVVLVAGEPGAGKSTLCLQSLFHGAKKGEKGVYITAISENPDQVTRFMSNYSFYDQAAVDKGLVKFVDVGATLLADGPHVAIEEAVRAHILHSDVKRVVIDPLSPFSYVLDTPTDYRRFLHEFFQVMRTLDTLTYLVAEYSPRDVTNTENYMADGVILLYLEPTENPDVFKPGIQIRKMRGTEHPKGIQRLGFTKDGMRVL